MCSYVICETAQPRLIALMTSDIHTDAGHLKHCHQLFRDIRHSAPSRWSQVSNRQFDAGRFMYSNQLSHDITHNENNSRVRPQSNRNQQHMPCGPRYECKDHGKFDCMNIHCVIYRRHKNFDKFVSKWWCDEENNQVFVVWDSHHGWLPGLLNISKDYYRIQDHLE